MRPEEHIDAKKKIRRCIFLCVVAAMLPFISFFWNPLNQPLELWIQRSGSLMVVITIYVEVILLSLDHYCDQIFMIDTMDSSPSDNIFPRDVIRQTEWHRCLKSVVIIELILGTVIWGYGDLLYNFYFLN